MIKIVKDRVQTTLKNARLFKGQIGKYQIISTFADNDVNEVHDAILNKYNSDISVVVMLKNNRVSWRRNRNSEVEVYKFAEKFNNGGGHKSAAGGNLTESFMDLCKTFQEIPNEFQ